MSKFNLKIQATDSYNVSTVEVSELEKQELDNLLESIQQGLSQKSLLDVVVDIVTTTSAKVKGNSPAPAQGQQGGYNNQQKQYTPKTQYPPRNQGGKKPVKLSEAQLNTAYKKKFSFMNEQDFKQQAESHNWTSWNDVKAFTEFVFDNVPNNASTFNPNQGQQQGNNFEVGTGDLPF